MAASPLVYTAARNNAEWCDAFCRTHGIAGRFRSDFWSSPVRTPPLYPDAVTLRPEVSAERLLAGIDTSEGCSVKDSFADLDLASAGFRPMFQAEWLHREPPDSRAAHGRGWSRVTTERQLGEWESTWAASPAAAGFFRPALLAIETIAVLARYAGERIIAGAIANRSEAVIGLSNVFATGGDSASAWSGGAEAAEALWGAMPVVGYDSDASLDSARRAGFETIGELVVWIT
jgi:hypothetical protein